MSLKLAHVLVADVLNEKQNEDVVLVLAGYRTQQLFPLVGKATHFRTEPSFPRKE
jgi:hypothetical protein